MMLRELQNLVLSAAAVVGLAMVATSCGGERDGADELGRAGDTAVIEKQNNAADADETRAEDDGVTRETIYAGVAKSRGVVELDGGVVANANPALTAIQTLEFDLVLTAGGDSVNLDPAPASNRTVITYIDPVLVLDDVAYTTTVITGNANSLLEPGELIRITVDVVAAGASIPPNYTFTLEIKPPAGSYMVVQRTTPQTLEPINELG